jgi:ribosomal protein S18 acetylase RimI-like enzyme
MDIQFLPAEIDDLDAIIPMMRDLYASDGLHFPLLGPSALRQLLSNSEMGRCEVIVDSKTYIGYFVLGFGFSLEFGGRDAFLDELYVAKGARGMGVGREAVARAASICREMGIRALHLEVNSENTAAQRLYRRAGFTPRHAGYDLLTLRLD